MLATSGAGPKSTPDLGSPQRVAGVVHKGAFVVMTRNPDRPLSPHLTIWKWGPHMLVSILHRITGAGLATIGAGVFVWWLVAVAGDADGYALFARWMTWKWSLIVWVGLTWAFFQHTLSGLRHF